MIIELFDILVLLFPISLIIIFLSVKRVLPFIGIRTRFSILYITYCLICITPLLLLAGFLGLPIIDNKPILIYEFHLDVLHDILTFEFDFFTSLVLSTIFLIFYLSFVVSQLALWLLQKKLAIYEVKGAFNFDLLPEVTKRLLIYKNIHVKVISERTIDVHFSLSYFSFLKKKNLIFLNQSIINKYTPEEYNAALVHEIGHIYNMDTVIYPIFNSLSVFLFFGPYSKTIKKNFFDRLEEKADQFALKYIEDPRYLAKAIIKCLSIVNETQIQLVQETGRELLVSSSINTDKKKLFSRIEKIVSIDFS